MPCGPINTLDQVFADPQVVARGMRIDLPHPTAGSVPQVASPLRYSATPVELRAAAAAARRAHGGRASRSGWVTKTHASRELAAKGIVGVAAAPP